MAVARYLDARGLLWCHVPNGEARNAVTGAKLNRMGVKRGVPDVLIFNMPEMMMNNRTRYNCTGLAIELKVGKNMPTIEQAEWIANLGKCGWRCTVCHSIDEVVAIVEQCYGK